MLKSEVVYRPVNTGPAYWGPGDRYTFLVTGEQTGNAYSVMEAFVPPDGGPPPHIHNREDETFYIAEGECSITIEDKTVLARTGDFVNIPRGVMHYFRNNGTVPVRMIVTFTPSGLEGFFRETLEPAIDRNAPPPQNIPAVVSRYLAAAPKYGLDILLPAHELAA